MIGVRKSSIHGRGCFAEVDIPKGVEITFSVILVDRGTLPNGFVHFFPWSPKFDSIVMGEMSFCNHSIYPNMKILSIDTDNFTKTFTSIRDIPKNSEIFLNYGYVP